MAEVLGIIGSIIGIIQVTSQVATRLNDLIQDIRDAPSEILHIRQEVNSLSAVLDSTEVVSSRHDLQIEDQALTRSLAEYLAICRTTMQQLHDFLQPLVQKGLGSRNVYRMIEWKMRRVELRAMQARLSNDKASLTLTIVALNGVLDGRRADDVKMDLGKIYQKLTDFNASQSGQKLRRRLEKDIDTDSVAQARTALSSVTDRRLLIGRFLEPEKVQEGTVMGDDVPNAFGIPDDLPNPEALFEAVRSGNKALLRSLITRGVNLASRSVQGMTALHYCALSNDTGLGTILLDAGAQINAKDFELRSPFRLALVSDSLTFAEVLVQRGCIVSDSIDEVRRIAVQEDEIPDRTQLFQALSTRLKPSEQFLFLQPGIRSGDSRGLDVFFNSGFDPGMKNRSGLSLLIYALLYERRSILRCLVSHGAEINDWMTPSVTEDLDPDLPYHRELINDIERGRTPLGIAAKVMRSVGMCEFLLDIGADPNLRHVHDGNGVLLLGLCAPRYLGQATALLRRGADPNISGPDCCTAMYWGPVCDNPQLTKLLLEHGGDPNYQWPNNGMTSLMLGVEQGNYDTARFLLEAGANKEVRNKRGMTALDIARGMNRSDIVELLS